MSQVSCKIEHHAIFFALIAKNSIELCGEEGKKAILKSMIIYGNERGKRMAGRAIANGDELTVMASQAYGEWVPNYPGQMTFGRIAGEPTLRTYISKCAWCEAWEEHKITEYGKYYCVDVDNAVFQGFNPDFVCTPLTESMSFGGERCEFDWGLPLSEKDIIDLNNKKAELGTSCVKDFNYHVAHLLHSFKRSLRNELDAVADTIIQKSLEDYTEKFGQEYLDVVKPYLKEF